MSIGNALAEGRRQAGLTITDVSQRTCIRETIIRDIERGDFSACGGDFYARGHVRSIARAVGLDPVPLISEYDATEGAPEAISAAEVFEPATAIKLRESRRPNWSGALAVAVVVIVAAGIFGYTQLGHKTGNGRPASAASAASAASHPFKPTPKASPTVSPDRMEITLTASQDCWVGLTGSTGQQFYSGTVTAGTTMRWTAWHQVFLSIGNPSGVTLRVNGLNPVPPGSVSPITITLTPRHVTGY